MKVNYCPSYSSVCSTGKSIATAGGYCGTDTEPLEKLIKLNNRFINMTGLLMGGLTATAEIVSDQFKAAFEMFESIRIFALTKWMTTPNAKGAYPLSSKELTWQKKTDRVFLFSHLSLKFVNGCHRWNLLDLGRVAKVSIGFLPVWKLVYDGLMVVSSVFNSWDAILKLTSEKKNQDLASHKIERWQARSATIALLRNGDPKEMEALGKKYSSKISILENEARLHADLLSKLSSNHADYQHLSVAKRGELMASCQAKAAKVAEKMTNKFPLWQGRLQKVETHNYQALAQELASKNIEGKIKKWEVIKANAVLSRTKNLMALVSAVAKIVVIALALTFNVFFVHFSAPYLFPILFFGIINDGAGMSKLLLDKFRKPQPVPVA